MNIIIPFSVRILYFRSVAAQYFITRPATTASIPWKNKILAAQLPTSRRSFIKKILTLLSHFTQHDPQGRLG